MLQNYGIFNTYVVDPEQKEIIKDIALDGLIDENVNVRNASCSALAGLLHSYFINVDEELIVTRRSNFFYLDFFPKQSLIIFGFNLISSLSPISKS